MNSTSKKKKVSYYYSIIKDYNLPDRPDTLNLIESMLIGEIRKGYDLLLRGYSTLFGKVIGEPERRIFGNRLVVPNELGLF